VVYVDGVNIFKGNVQTVKIYFLIFSRKEIELELKFINKKLEMLRTGQLLKKALLHEMSY
jgi:hypothetical protein